jgi:hypothetical protein
MFSSGTSFSSSGNWVSFSSKNAVSLSFNVESFFRLFLKKLINGPSENAVSTLAKVNFSLIFIENVCIHSAIYHETGKVNLKRSSVLPIQISKRKWPSPLKRSGRDTFHLPTGRPF